MNYVICLIINGYRWAKKQLRVIHSLIAMPLPMRFLFCTTYPAAMKNEYLPMKMANRSGGDALNGKHMFKSYFIKNSVLFICLLLLALSVFQSSRSFIIGYSASIIFIIHGRYGSINNRRITAFLLLVIISMATLLAMLYKQDSSSGRLLIYKISSAMLNENFWRGIGIGNFQLMYGHYQAEYFKSGNFSTRELLLADNTYYAFNDYYQFIIEWGVTGGLIMILYFSGVIKLLNLSFANGNSNKPILLFSTTQLIAVSVAAFFTHLFEKTFFQCTLATCIVIIAYIAFKLKLSARYVTIFLLILNGMIIFFNNAFYIIHYQAYQQWRKAKTLNAIGAKQEALKNYQALYPELKNDPDFLISYGDFFLAKGWPEKSIPLYEQAITMRTANRLFINLGNCYYLTNQHKKAETTLLKSVYIVPNRLSSRYQLFTFYCNTNQKEKAITCGNAIIRLPVKVPSAHAQFIQIKVNEKLNLLVN
jgi:tetratricopeptide (TPR) repeat protein